MFALELKNVNYKVKGFALKEINFTIPKGMITGLVGRNGAGKTTLIHIIGNNLERESGTILYDGIRFWEDEAGIKRKLGIVYDTTNFNEQFTAKKFKKKFAPLIDGFDIDYFDKYMEKFELPYNINFVKYSPGMKRKFMLILTLSRKPEILIMDEPTSGVDPADRYEMLDMLQEFVEDEKHSVVFSTHITSDLDKIADYLIFIDSGRIVIEGEKEELLEKYRMIDIPNNLILEGVEKRMIGAKKNSFGITGITSDVKLWNTEGVIIRRLVVEDLAIHIREIHEKGVL
ncbi:ABC transporter ATP-binding protein [[Clostridium] fimetarium]|uniref:ABC-2 type transport system ATP-binding protein n=1 Tax=[Clostridium] fimetarium TaxID=99656 RepID=A0A1I0P7P2_9FIRM|nr:ABC transporter ATP-binding protein [[Clostridium] fimetarium]SEW10369.1 ABC-2 type transport system ATP-binding protein [[Clostridium] fimetarium]